MITLSHHFRFRPKLLECLKGYNRDTFVADGLAGITVGIVALPLAMAFAIASGVRPEAGIFTAIIAGFIISALGGSRVQIGGPTGAYVVIIYGIVAQYGLANLLICTLMAGCILLAMGMLRLGVMIKFIPLPVIIGFTNGIAVLIFLSQIKDFLGLETGPLPAEFFSQLRALSAVLHTVNWTTLAVASASLLLLAAWPANWGKRLPGAVVVLVLGGIATAVFHLQIETIGSRFGGIPQTLPQFSAPEVSLDQLRNLIVPAITIALLGAIESLLCAVVADGMIKDKHDANQELIAQGIANIVVPFFGGIPATGAIARTSTNIRNGGRTPVAGIVHAMTLLAIILAAAPLARHLPLACMSAILIMVAVQMGEWRAFIAMPRYSHGRTGTLLSTFILTVVFDLTIAVQVGILWASLLLIRRMAQITVVARAPQSEEHPDGVAVYAARGVLFFGAADTLEVLTRDHERGLRVLILDLDHALYIDSTATHALEMAHLVLSSRGVTLLVCGASQQPATLIRQSGLSEMLSQDGLLADRAAAIARARNILQAG
ncbi:MAG: C4-dicarboxylic acid transporter DauA [Betaproteobacteria bacterium]|nr:C4-dicarboxylic acid transporter DauA [Betaproteobacteria bacterium]